MNDWGENQIRVFISYKRDADPDERLAQLIFKAFTPQHRIFFDQRSITPAADWPRMVDQELRQADVLLAFISGASLKSNMVVEEILRACELAQTQNGRPIVLPIYLNYRGELPYHVGAHLRHIQGVFYDGPQDEARLLEAIHQLLSGRPFLAVRTMPPRMEQWLHTLNRLRKEGQISAQDYQNVLQYALNEALAPDTSQPEIEDKLLVCAGLDQRLYWTATASELRQQTVSSKNARLHQILTALCLGVDLCLTQLGIRFVLIPPGTARAGTSNPESFYLAETLLSEVQWAAITQISTTSPDFVPKLNLSVREIERFLANANGRLAANFRLSFPSSEQWKFAAIAAEAQVPFEPDRKLELKASSPCAFGLYDLLGIAWQICAHDDQRGYEAQGGSYLSLFSHPREIPRPGTISYTSGQSETWGFRPALTF